MPMADPRKPHIPASPTQLPSVRTSSKVSVSPVDAADETEQTGDQSTGGASATVLAFPTPPKRKGLRNVLIGVAAVVVVIALVMAIALFSPALAVKKIDYVGRTLVSEKTLATALAPLVEKSLTQISDEDVATLLQSVPQVKSSWIEARPPSTLRVHIVERVPVALLSTGKTFYLVDQDGVQLGTAADRSKAGLPLIDGGKAVVGKATFQAITAVLATLPKSILGKLSSASAKSPDAVELKMTDGKLVVWGNASDMELKAKVLEALINAPAPTPDPNKPGETAPASVKVYDVSTPRYPVTR